MGAKKISKQTDQQIIHLIARFFLPFNLFFYSLFIILVLCFCLVIGFDEETIPICLLCLISNINKGFFL